MLLSGAFLFSWNNSIAASGEDFSERIYQDIPSPNGKQAEFPGGISALMKVLSENIVYPEYCWQNNIEGKVLVEFVICKDGSVGQTEVIKSAHPLLDEEAVRVVKLLPKWLPAELDGEKVDFYFTLPITFRIPQDSSENSDFQAP